MESQLLNEIIYHLRDTHDTLYNLCGVRGMQAQVVLPWDLFVRVVAVVCERNRNRIDDQPQLSGYTFDPTSGAEAFTVSKRIIDAGSIDLPGIGAIVLDETTRQFWSPW